jgi:hypothetical protein
MEAHNFKVTTPAEMNVTTSQMIKDALDAFEKEIKKQTKGEHYYHLVVEGEFKRPTCDMVEKIYKDAGWTKVQCRTSSENGERGGLTGLILSV